MNKSLRWLLFGLIGLLLLAIVPAFAVRPVLNITVTEYATERVAFNGTIERPWDEAVYVSWSGEQLWALRVVGTINITNVANVEVASINITLNNTDNLQSAPTCTAPAGTTVIVSGSPGQPIYIYISSLKPGESVVCDYNLTTTFTEPINITEIYSKSRVIVGKPMNITIVVKNQLSSEITSLEINKTPGCYPKLGGGLTCWNITAVYGPDAANAQLYPYTVGGVTYFGLYWQPNGSYLGAGQSVNITITVVPPTDANLTWSDTDWGHWLNAGNITVNFVAPVAMSGLTVEKIVAIPLNTTLLELIKERVNATHWRTQMAIEELQGIEMKIIRADMWSENRSTVQAGNVSRIYNISGSYWNLTSPVYVDSSRYESENRTFEWPYVIVAFGTIVEQTVNDSEAQIPRSVIIGSNPDKPYGYVEDVYVVNSYYVQAYKYVNETGTKGEYLITIVIKNVGTQPTPQVIYVYELVPPDFTNTTPISVSGVTSYSIIDMGTIAAGEYAGYHLWAIRIEERLQPGQNVTISYRVAGSGTYDLNKVYILGVDPMRMEGYVVGINDVRVLLGNVEEESDLLYAVVGLAVLGAGLVVISRRQ